MNYVIINFMFIDMICASVLAYAYKITPSTLVIIIFHVPLTAHTIKRRKYDK